MSLKCFLARGNSHIVEYERVLSGMNNVFSLKHFGWNLYHSMWISFLWKAWMLQQRAESSWLNPKEKKKKTWKIHLVRFWEVDQSENSSGSLVKIGSTITLDQPNLSIFGYPNSESRLKFLYFNTRNRMTACWKLNTLNAISRINLYWLFRRNWWKWLLGIAGVFLWRIRLGYLMPTIVNE